MRCVCGAMATPSALCRKRGNYSRVLASLHLARIAGAGRAGRWMGAVMAQYHSDASMIQLRPGDLVAVRKDDAYFVFAILTKQTLFGGHWSFAFHGSRPTLPSVDDELAGPGFNAAVDFIVPKRENRVVRVRRGNDFSSLFGPELLQQYPTKGETNYRIWRWRNYLREEAEYVRFTPSPSPEERSAPHYACIPADWACDRAARGWKEHESPWVENG
jgi:hypothetical protein